MSHGDFYTGYSETFTWTKHGFDEPGLCCQFHTSGKVKGIHVYSDEI